VNCGAPRSRPRMSRLLSESDDGAENRHGRVSSATAYDFGARPPPSVRGTVQTPGRVYKNRMRNAGQIGLAGGGLARRRLLSARSLLLLGRSERVV
jgi:hypothetical protein